LERLPLFKITNTKNRPKGFLAQPQRGGSGAGAPNPVPLNRFSTYIHGGWYICKNLVTGHREFLLILLIRTYYNGISLFAYLGSFLVSP